MNLGFDVKDWEEAEAKEVGEFEVLELGGHEVVIKDARIYESEFSGNQSLKVCVDIAGNDKQKGYFEKQLRENPPITEKQIRAMYSQMGRKPSEAQIRQIMNSMKQG